MKIEFKTDGAAFEDGELIYEVDNILTKITFWVREGRTEGAILDSNGNTVGSWSL